MMRGPDPAFAQHRPDSSWEKLLTGYFGIEAIGQHALVLAHHLVIDADIAKHEAR
jgi:hypothetical protein